MTTDLMIGDLAVSRIEESCGPFWSTDLFANLPNGAFDREMHWLAPNYFDIESQLLNFSSHSWVVRTKYHVVLIDTCIGNDKPRWIPDVNEMQTPYLERLASVGLTPGDIDFVVCTHLHVDHVGWNTRLLDGRWVPTFPKARYLFGRQEFEHARRVATGPDPEWEGVFYNDSILPVVEAGQVELVDDGYTIDDSLVMEAAYGHTPGHMVVRATGLGQTGLFTGDMIHHPIQIHHPDVNSRFCMDPDAAATSRRRFLSECADRGHLLLPAHFGPPHFGRISRNGVTFRFEPGLG
ncbi:MBL fold metallo-hydrolase [Streptomyces sp. NPDC090499]|uniref:MBL fold metallo-hydrolase n=1 Tax=unclassified Streptomyces TaxID=2593676 RepID=UPI0038005CAB